METNKLSYQDLVSICTEPRTDHPGRRAAPVIRPKEGVASPVTPTGRSARKAFFKCLTKRQRKLFRSKKSRAQ